MRDGFDITRLTAFQRRMLTLAQQRMPRESKKFMRTEGTKLRRRIVAKAKQKVGKISGGYIKSIKRGKLYEYNGSLSVRVYSSAPHAHLLEYGHRQIEKHRRIFIDGQYVTLKRFPGEKETGFVPGKYVFTETRKDFEAEFVRDAENFIDEMLTRGL